jgi:hypothetical protein
MSNSSTATRRALAAIAIAFTGALAPTAASGAPQAVCPSEDGWVKVDLTEDGVTSVEVTAPEGMVVVATCVKAGTGIATTVEAPGTTSVVLVTPAVNHKGDPKAISHYSYLVGADDVVNS